MNFKALQKTLRDDPYILRLSLFLSIVYGLVYYWSTGFIIFRRGLALDSMTASDPTALLWQMRGPFLWEAIAQLNLPILGTLMLSVPNLLIAFLLTLLVYSNLVVVLIGIRHPAYCPINKKRKGSSLVAMLPALFSGFGCCAPTVIILWVSIFGSVSSVMMVAVRWLLPVGLIFLIIGFISGYRSLTKNPIN